MRQNADGTCPFLGRCTGGIGWWNLQQIERNETKGRAQDMGQWAGTDGRKKGIMTNQEIA
jgi:hypothetical protein